MEKHLFLITFILNCFLLLLSFTGVISAPVMITDIMKNDTKLCNASKFLYDSKYTNLCTSLKYPTDPSEFAPITADNFLCLGVYDTAYKICQYSSRQTSFNSTASFNLYIENLFRDNNEEFDKDLQEKFCTNLGGLTLSYNKTYSYLEPLIKNLHKLDKCKKICFDFNDHLHQLCAILGWIKSVENDVKKSNYDSIAPLQSTDQLYDEALNDNKTSVNKMSKETEQTIKEQTREPTTTDFKDHSDNKDVKQSIADGNEPSTNIKPYSEKVTSKPEESSKIQKTVDNTLIKTSKGKNIIDDKPGTKKMSANNEVSSKNNAENNVPNKNDVNEGKSEDIKKKQNIDVKSTTLSENTQEYDDLNPEEEATGDLNDVDDTVQQSNIGNSNDNVPEAIEKTNSRFSNLRTEDDSHFFTYFTVIAMMCIIGYIGYCNKQKIFAIVLEGRRSKNNRNRRRPSTASYRKLDCTLEEAVTSQCNANVTHVIY